MSRIGRALAHGAGVLLLWCTPTILPAQAALAPLHFLDIEAGASIDEVRARVRASDGRLDCQTSKADARVRDCRGRFSTDDGTPVDVWLSAINGTAGIITLSAPLEDAVLQAWRADLAERYGRVGARAQGPQWTEQWIRQGRMARLTWRTDKGDKRMSVSLVDGPTLDGWQAPRGATRRAARASSPPTDSVQSLEPPLHRP